MRAVSTPVYSSPRFTPADDSASGDRGLALYLRWPAYPLSFAAKGSEGRGRDTGALRFVFGAEDAEPEHQAKCGTFHRAKEQESQNDGERDQDRCFHDEGKPHRQFHQQQNRNHDCADNEDGEYGSAIVHRNPAQRSAAGRAGGDDTKKAPEQRRPPAGRAAALETPGNSNEQRRVRPGWRRLVPLRLPADGHVIRHLLSSVRDEAARNMRRPAPPVVQKVPAPPAGHGGPPGDPVTIE